MATKKKETSLSLKAQLNQIRLDIFARQEKNTNAHKALKKQIAQELTKKK